MPRFYFHIKDAQGSRRDPQGRSFATASEARWSAIKDIRSHVSAQTLGGVVDLCGEVTITDKSGNPLLQIKFSEAFSVQMPDGKYESSGFGYP